MSMKRMFIEENDGSTREITTFWKIFWIIGMLSGIFEISKVIYILREKEENMKIHRKLKKTLLNNE